jgi:platelet-activating factor acetylhydrolase IB subunit alpha
MIITARQREELHKAILAYFNAQGFTESAQNFSTEAQVTEEVAADLLEKKWTSVVRL